MFTLVYICFTRYEIRQRISFVQLGAYIGIAHTDTGNSLNETLTHSLTLPGRSELEKVKPDGRILTNTICP